MLVGWLIIALACNGSNDVRSCMQPLPKSPRRRRIYMTADPRDATGALERAHGGPSLYGGQLAREQRARGQGYVCEIGRRVACCLGMREEGREGVRPWLADIEASHTTLVSHHHNELLVHTHLYRHRCYWFKHKLILNCLHLVAPGRGLCPPLHTSSLSSHMEEVCPSSAFGFIQQATPLTCLLLHTLFMTGALRLPDAAPPFLKAKARS